MVRGDLIPERAVHGRVLSHGDLPCHKTHGRPNALASALLTFLQLLVQQLRGPAHLTSLAANPDRPGPLTPTQIRAFTSTLQALHTMPDFLALHAQAGSIAATWFSPITDGSFQ